MGETAEIVEVEEPTRTLQPIGEVGQVSTETLVDGLAQRMDAIQQIMESVMKPNVDYGVIPGTKKPTLYQPGAEILFRLFKYSFEVEILDEVEDWDKPFFRYKVKGIAKDESGRVIAEGLGETNSKESRYEHRYCPECESGVWDNRNDRRGGAAFVCKGKCGWTAEKPKDVPTRFDFELVNTILKMATKRAKISAALTGTAASHFFTQDAEDLPQGYLDAEAPKSPDDPHCPACLVSNGELVGVSGPHDKKPYWRCTNKSCAGSREHNGKVYSWSGWHTSWEKSRDEWVNNNPRGEVTVGRRNHSAYIVDEVMRTLAISKEDAKTLVKPALVYAIGEQRFDPEPALGEPLLSNDLSDDQLRTIVKNLDAAEAQIVVTAACELGSGPEAA